MRAMLRTREFLFVGGKSGGWTCQRTTHVGNMAPARLLERNVRVPQRALEEDDGVQWDDLEDESQDEDDGGSDSSSISGTEKDEVDVSVEGSDDGGGDVGQQISSVSFGALKKAQDTLSQKRKRDSDAAADDEGDRLGAMRKRLREIRENKDIHMPAPTKQQHKGARQLGSDAEFSQEEDDVDDDDDDAPSEEDTTPQKARTSKHAPTALSSKHQVTRKRTVIDVPKSRTRDPRFDALHQHTSSQHPGASENKAYSFLTDYQKSELADLKVALKRTRNEDDRETLRRKINSMENRLKALASKEREQAVLRQHRKEEREKVQAGKTPYHLKKKEVKERALVEKFKAMKAHERTKAVEKRRIRESQRERRRMPRDRRDGAGS
jgi:ribosomal RNA-processing protein 36